MKNILFVILLAFSSCGENDEIDQSNQIIGKWSLVNVMAGFSPEEIYDSGIILWEFTSENQILVEINTELNESSNVPLNNNGTYNFELIENKINIEDIEYEYHLDNGHLILSHQVASDGPRLEFIIAD
ncbi:MAG: hypothetical protein P8I82_06565 [Flavobacteriales bacterium]|nr:hypothetical protein [Flavobacteriales bacterium]